MAAAASSAASPRWLAGASVPASDRRRRRRSRPLPETGAPCLDICRSPRHGRRSVAGRRKDRRRAPASLPFAVKSGITSGVAGGRRGTKRRFPWDRVRPVRGHARGRGERGWLPRSPARQAGPTVGGSRRRSAACGCAAAGPTRPLVLSPRTAGALGPARSPRGARPARSAHRR